MSTRIETTRTLVSEDVVQFVRPVTIRLTLTAARPNTRMFVFFDGVNLTEFAAITGNAPGTEIRSDSAGQAVIDVNIPGGRFAPGDKEIIVTDTNDLANLDTTGSVFGYAKTNFTSRGRVQVFDTTTTRITTVTNTQNVVYDPLAQSFFTYGARGGIFVSSIDVFFQTKDDTIPVRVDIRPLINGYPSDPWNIIRTQGVEAVSVKNPEDVNISANGSVPTKFEFDPPVYLEEDKDYCFVVFSVSPNYNIFTSRMGERDLTTGHTIFEQPFIGSMFKSENNITWEASQFEDIKFVINRARFDISSDAQLNFAVDMPFISANLNQFRTTAGSRVIEYRHNQDHGLEIGDKIAVYFNRDGVYNGIPGTSLSDVYDVVNIIDRRTVQFLAGGSTNATVSGQINSTLIINEVQVDNGGSGYQQNATIEVIGSGTGAVLTPVIDNGVIRSVIVTDPGFGYTSAPILNVVSPTGSGAQLVAIVDQPVAVKTNKPFQGFIPDITLKSYSASSTESVIEAVTKNYEGGNLVTYSPGGVHRFATENRIVDIRQNLMVASRENEVEKLNNSDSVVVRTTMRSNNDASSPIYNLRAKPRIKVFSRLINNQTGETRSASAGSGQVSSIVVTAPGSGYSAIPTVIISPPNLPGGVQATATATTSSGSITAINVTNPGSGYTHTPLVVITRGSGDTTGIGGAAQAQLTEFNSELLPSGGNARAKYITKRNVLATISTGVRLFAEISSGSSSNVDWYIRTSLSASNVDHEELGWRRLQCDVERNRSSSSGEFLDYEFRLDGIPEFDTYDLKCVLLAEDPTQAPVIKSYRVIVIV